MIEGKFSRQKKNRIRGAERVEMGLAAQVLVAILNRIFTIGLTEKMIFEAGLKEVGVSFVGIWEKRPPGRGTGRAKTSIWECAWCVRGALGSGEEGRRGKSPRKGRLRGRGCRTDCLGFS